MFLLVLVIWVSPPFLYFNVIMNQRGILIDHTTMLYLSSCSNSVGAFLVFRYSLEEAYPTDEICAALILISRMSLDFSRGIKEIHTLCIWSVWIDLRIYLFLLILYNVSFLNRPHAYFSTLHAAILNKVINIETSNAKAGMCASSEKVCFGQKKKLQGL